MRTGSEPTQARSPLRARLALTVFGLVWAFGGMAIFLAAGHPGWVAVFAAIALVAAVDLTVIVHHLRQGPHYQPGRDVPPYWPVDRDIPPYRRSGRDRSRWPR
ncbi:DUF6343 family protein [Streptomyces sp. PTM05]|uniref:DUF6343 family protein n=1 Tax=Streptantibioticus parmotrematis TaxID=2873249 RepID=A0ABS7QWL8_9ACTN|nr:DUF6343 family protein [Streptantibioticus parmotrematis]MBY8887606.1 DUF6343 family protein [Streptantibioticus parmotrematis]